MDIGYIRLRRVRAGLDRAETLSLQLVRLHPQGGLKKIIIRALIIWK